MVSPRPGPVLVPKGAISFWRGARRRIGCIRTCPADVPENSQPNRSRMITKLSVFAVLSVLLLVTGCQSHSPALHESGGILLTPLIVAKPVHRQVGMREGQDLSRLAFQITTTWSDGPIELRFPEVLRSSAGFHFLDNYAAGIQPTCEWSEFPQWQTDPASG